MPLTNGFASPATLADHYNRHKAEFGGPLPRSAYLALADAFLGGPCPPDTLECVRSLGDVLRYNVATFEFGILKPGRIIRTYFRPTPDWHKLATNEDYFYQECSRY